MKFAFGVNAALVSDFHGCLYPTRDDDNRHKMARRFCIIEVNAV